MRQRILLLFSIVLTLTLMAIVAGAESGHPPSFVAVPGFSEMHVESGQKERSISIKNPSTNELSFSVSMCLPNGDEIFNVPAIAPGDEVSKVELKNLPPEGVYENCIINVQCYKGKTRVNSINFAIDLYVGGLV